MKPLRVLSLWAGTGGACMGYRANGFEVISVDTSGHAEWADTGEYIGMDPLRFLEEVAGGWHDGMFDVIHAAPPVTWKTQNAGRNRTRTQILDAARELLEEIGLPYVIEGQPNAQLDPDTTITLCGEMFGLRVIRHRKFQPGNGLTLAAPPHRRHRGKVTRDGKLGYYVAVYGGEENGTVQSWQQALGVPWTDCREALERATPPRYVGFIADQIAQQLTVSA